MFCCFCNRTCFTAQEVVSMLRSNTRVLKVPTCHQELDAALLWHLLRWMVGDEIKHVGSGVRLPQVRDPQRAVPGSGPPQVLNPVCVGLIGENGSTVEHVPEAGGRLRFCPTLKHEVCSEWYLGVMQRFCSRHHISDRTLYCSPC